MRAINEKEIFGSIESLGVVDRCLFLGHIINGILREKVKVQRGWKKMNTPLAEGQRIQYNFVKPHLALKGETPAKKVKIEVKAKNKWMRLLENGMKIH